MKAILFNAMYTGNYLDSKLGHEAINLFAPDKRKDGKNACYIYINALGKIALDKKESNNPEIECVLLGQLVEDGKFKVIAKATGLKMLESTKEIILKTGAKGEKDKSGKYKYQPLCDELWNDHLNELSGVEYGGVPLAGLFPGERQVLATFSAEKVVKVKGDKDVYIFAYYYKTKGESDTGFRLPESKHDGTKTFKFAKTSPYMYFREWNNNGEEMEDYKELHKIIDQIEWEDTSVGTYVNNAQPITTVEIMGKEDSELSYSNMIAYWLGRKQENLQEFVSFLKGKNPQIPTTESIINIGREIDNIDLLISYENTRIIIENKIKADIAVYKDNKNQLVKYRESMTTQGLVPYCFLLSPQYRKIDSTKHDKNYIQLSYRDLFNFFNKHKNDFTSDKCSEQFLYNEFLLSLEMHSNDTDNKNYIKMMRRMGEAINRYKESSN